METSLRQSSVVNDASIPRITLEPDFVTGFCEGEASFTYVRNGNSLNLRFAVRLQESDKALVFSLKSFFGVGHLYHVGPRKPAAHSGNTGASWYYCVTSIDELTSIIRHFDQYPLKGRKAENYAVWKQIYDLKRIPRKADAVAVNNLALTLSGMSTKGRRSLKPKALQELG